jgi:hypothetical protein
VDEDYTPIGASVVDELASARKPSEKVRFVDVINRNAEVGNRGVRTLGWDFFMTDGNDVSDTMVCQVTSLRDDPDAAGDNDQKKKAEKTGTWLESLTFQETRLEPLDRRSSKEPYESTREDCWGVAVDLSLEMMHLHLARSAGGRCCWQ